MCCLLLKSPPKHIDVIELVFPIPGHSFIPPDRNFGNIEKYVKHMEVTVDPKEYMNIIGNHVTVALLGSDYQVCDWKHAMKTNIEPPGSWYFQFSVYK
jgi:hypothetical protein